MRYPPPGCGPDGAEPQRVCAADGPLGSTPGSVPSADAASSQPRHSTTDSPALSNAAGGGS